MTTGRPAPNQCKGRLSRMLLSDHQWQTIVDDLHLSPREVEIVMCLFDGSTEQGIALALGISPHTVHTHMERLYHKIHVQSRCEVALRVFETFLNHTGCCESN